MLFGISIGQSVMLTDIARALKEDITLKKTHELLSKNLTKFDSQDELIDNYNETIKPQKKPHKDSSHCLNAVVFSITQLVDVKNGGSQVIKQQCQFR